MSKSILNSYKKNQEIDLDDIPLTDMQTKGVVYEPTSDKHSESLQKNSVKPKIKKPQNFNFKIFLASIILSGLFIFGVVFYLTYTSFYPNLFSDLFSQENSKNSLTLEEIKNDSSSELFIVEEIELTGVIQGIDYTKKIVEVSDLKSNEPYYLYITGNTALKDKYNKSLSMKEFKLGDVVDFSFNEKDELNYLIHNKEIVEYKSVKNVTIDSSNKLIKFENKIINYNNYIKVTRNLEEYPLEKITSLDSLNIKVYNNIVYSIEVEKSHGNLIFVNREGLLNATVEIDTDIFKSLGDISEISLTEGEHKIVIKENNINTFIKEVYISPNEDTIIDLSEVQLKSGLLLINSNVSGYTLYVNNEIKTTNEPLQLPYGAYKIKIEKSGYVSFESEVVINSSQRVLNVTLESLEYAGKLTLTSNPEGVEVYVDNIFVGYTPLTYKTNYGNHTVLLKKTGYEDFDLQNVYVSETETSFNIIMRKKEEAEATTNNTSESTEELETTE